MTRLKKELLYITQQLAMTVDAREIDVWCGRGSKHESNLGNKMYAKLIKRNSHFYRRASREWRIPIVKNIRRKCGRFLDENDSGCTKQCSEAFVLQKFDQVLRDSVNAGEKKSRRQQQRRIVPVPPCSYGHKSMFEGLPETNDSSLSTDKFETVSICSVETSDEMDKMLGDGVVVYPSIRDIVFCQGRKFYQHPGNIAFREKLRAICVQCDYSAFVKEEKGKVLTNIYESFMVNGSVFLVVDKDDECRELEKREALTKIGSALRYTIRQQQRRAGCRGPKAAIEENKVQLGSCSVPTVCEASLFTPMLESPLDSTPVSVHGLPSVDALRMLEDERSTSISSISVQALSKPDYIFLGTSTQRRAVSIDSASFLNKSIWNDPELLARAPYVLSPQKEEASDKESTCSCGEEDSPIPPYSLPSPWMHQYAGHRSNPIMVSHDESDFQRLLCSGKRADCDGWDPEPEFQKIKRSVINAASDSEVYSQTFGGLHNDDYF